GRAHQLARPARGLAVPRPAAPLQPAQPHPERPTPGVARTPRRRAVLADRDRAAVRARRSPGLPVPRPPAVGAVLPGPAARPTTGGRPGGDVGVPAGRG